MRQDRRFKPDYGNSLALLDIICTVGRWGVNIIFFPIFLLMMVVGILVDVMGFLAYVIVPTCIIAFVIWLLTTL